jgi:hypothetical protein
VGVVSNVRSMERRPSIGGGPSGSLRHRGGGVGARRGSRRWHDGRGKRRGRRWPAHFKGRVPQWARWRGGAWLGAPGAEGEGGSRPVTAGGARPVAARPRRVGWRWAAPGGTLKQGREGEADRWGRATQYQSPGSNPIQNILNMLNSKFKLIQILTHPKRTFL